MKDKFKILDYILIIALLISIVIVLIIIIKSLEKKSIQEDAINNGQKVINVEQNNIDDNNLQSMTERERMEYYFSEFMDNIENEKYQEAYDLLYPEFRDTYFKTLDEFKEYVNKIYPDFVSFSYNDIDRQGYIYVLTITVINPNVSKDETKKSQRIVIKENNFNDFVLSFQII